MGALPVLHWREDEFIGILSVNIPLKTGMSLFVKPLQWEVVMEKWLHGCHAWLYDDEFPLVAKGLSSSCTVFLSPHQMDLENEHYLLCSSVLRLQGLKNWIWNMKNCLLGCRDFPSWGHRLINPTQQGNWSGGSEPANQDSWPRLP